VRKIADRYVASGLDAALEGEKKSIGPRKNTSDRIAQVLAVLDSKPPDGKTRWYTRLIVEELHRRGITDGISAHSVWVALKKAGVDLTSQNSVSKKPTVPDIGTIDMTSQVLAVVGSKPPYGRRLWTNDLIVEELRRRGIRDGVTAQSVWTTLRRAGIDLKYGNIAGQRRVMRTFRFGDE
jgi:transposase